MSGVRVIFDRCKCHLMHNQGQAVIADAGDFKLMLLPLDTGQILQVSGTQTTLDQWRYPWTGGISPASACRIPYFHDLKDEIKRNRIFGAKKVKYD